MQLICYNKLDQAFDFQQKLQKKDYAVYLNPIKRKDKSIYYCVRVGPLGDKTFAKSVLKKLNKAYRLQGYLIPVKK